MALSLRTTGIISSSVIAIVMIAGAYAVSGSHPLFSLAKANAESTDGLLKAYASKDTDSDGLPDWEESLYGTDVNNAHSVNSSVTDGQAVSQGLIKPKFLSAVATSTDTGASIPGPTAAAGSLTDQFGRTFLTNYLEQSGGTPPSEDQIAQMAQQFVGQILAHETRPDVVTLSTAIPAPSGSDSLRYYAAAFDAAYTANNSSGSETEIEYLTDAVEKNDTTAPAHVLAIGKGYTALAQTLAKIPVPTEAASAHVALANAFSHLGQAVTDMGAFSTDPLRAFLGIAEYGPAVKETLTALPQMALAFSTDGLVLSKGQGGYLLYQLSTVAAQNAATQQ